MVRQSNDRPDITERLNGAHAESDYDALADLFLGDAPGPKTPTATSANNPTTTVAAITPTAGTTIQRPPVIVDAMPDNDPVAMSHGPCCSRVGPIGGAATAKPATRRVDVLVLGHLPGIGGTWAAQQARTIATQLDTPACLLRLSGGQLVVDLIWPDDARPPVFPACADATAAARIAARHAGAWLLRVQASEETLLESWMNRPANSDACVDRVRLLTGADDPAIVGAYRRLKAWHASSPHGFARMARVTIVEGDAAKAAAAEARLRKAASSFLDTHLAPAERLGAMRPVRVTNLYCGPYAGDFAELLQLIRNVSAEVPQASRNDSTESSADRSASNPAVPHDAPAPNAFAASPKSSIPHHRPTAESSVAAASPTNGTRPATPHAAQAISHGVATGHEPTADHIVAMIARSAGIDTLRAAATACPWAPAIVIAVDHQGEAHAIAFARDEAHVSLAAVDLLTASRWCAEHASLLAMAGITPRAGDTTLHLLTTAPAAARRLADTGLRVHAAVRVGESWGAVALS